ncbi:MAG: F0F1 ATP synthase subunit A [Pirellulales bacterium]
MAHDPLAPEHLMAHVKDAEHFEVPRMLAEGGHLAIPQPFAPEKPLWVANTGNSIVDGLIEPFDLRITKFMVLEVVAAVILCVVFISLANRMTKYNRPRGRWWNMMEAMLLFFRDYVTRPAIGKHDGDRFLPFVWTMFFFVLGCNLLGLIPWLGSPTGAIATTGALAFCTFVVLVGSGTHKLGVVGFWKGQVPHMEMHPIISAIITPMIFVIEVLGLLIKHFVLAVRLLANMLAGHLVLAVIVGFIAVSAGSIAWFGVMPASIAGASGLMLLELFVAFLQAYIFAFLSALFIGMAVHPH